MLLTEPDVIWPQLFALCVVTVTKLIFVAIVQHLINIDWIAGHPEVEDCWEPGEVRSERRK